MPETPNYPDWLKQILSDVKAMRTAQDKFFKHRGKTHQYEAMKWEHKVDEWLKKCEEKGIIGTTPPAQQTNLFN